MRVADQSAQALEVLDGVAQAIDVVEPQPLQLAFRDQPSDQAMDRLEGAGVLDAQPRQRIDVEKAPVVDVAGSKPPVAELIVLAFEQMGSKALPLRDPDRLDLFQPSRAISAAQRSLNRPEAALLAVGASRPLITGGSASKAAGALSSAPASLEAVRGFSP